MAERAALTRTSAKVTPGVLALATLTLGTLVLWLAAGPGGEPGARFLGELFGVEAVVLFSCSLVLATLLPIVEAAFGGLDRVALWHRRVAIGGLLLLLPHVALVSSPADPFATSLGHGLGDLALAGLAILGVWAVAPRLRAARWPGPIRRMARASYEHWLTAHRLTGLRAVAVFDVSQTEGLPGTESVSLESPSQPIEGDTHAHLLPALEQLAVELGYSVARRPLDGPADGWCDSHKHEIVINEALPANAQVRVLVHEIAHALGGGYTDYGRRRAEVLVDTVTFIVCGAVGLDTSRSTVPYVAGRVESGELDAIRGYAETIDEIARRIEDSLRHASEDQRQPASLAA